MSGSPDRKSSSITAYAPPWLQAAGARAWLVVGLVAASAVVVWFIGATAGLMIPLVLAVVLGMLFAPLVEALEKRRVPRLVGASLVMLLLLAIAIATVWITVAGVLTQVDEIVQVVSDGLASLKTWAGTLDIPTVVVDEVTTNAEAQFPKIASGAASAFSSGLSGAIAFFFGAFIGAFMLYYMLTDWTGLANWVGRHLGYPEDVGTGIVTDGTAAVRQYFKSVTISGLVVAALITATMLLLQLPLAVPIGIVTFMTAYIPYIGAIFSGAFAFLVALGSGGLTQAIIVLMVVLIAQNVVQTVVVNYFASQELELHPLVTLIATILGGTFAGLIGAMLGAPVAAMGVRAGKRIRDYHRREDDEEAAGEQAKESSE